jgi:hypothetical protein
MQWLEIIRFRTALERKQKVTGLLRDILATIGNSDGLLHADLYSHASVVTDVSVHLLWDRAINGSGGSELAIGIKDALEPLGLLDYTVWLREQDAPAAPEELPERLRADEPSPVSGVSL